MTNDERPLWEIADGPARVTCVMISCCAGAELQVRRGDAIVLRELYPTKSDLYERARALEGEYRGAATTETQRHGGTGPEITTEAQRHRDPG